MAHGFSEAERLEYQRRRIQIAEEREKATTEFKSTYPNLASITADGSESPEYILELSVGLLALVELYDLQERVFRIEIHGSSPVVYLILDPNPNDPTLEQFKVGKIYEYSRSNNAPPSYCTEGWDPSQLGIPATDIGMGNYLIEI